MGLYKSVTSERLFEIPGHMYVLQFTYNLGYATVPLTNPPGAEHYPSEIKLFEIVSGAKVQVGEPFSGDFTDGKCWEDEPSGLVERQLSRQGFIPEDVTAGLKKYRDDKAYEAMKLYELYDGVLSVTRKGVAESINEIQVDGKTVWKNPNPPLIKSPFVGIVTGSGTAGTYIWRGPGKDGATECK